MSVIFSTMAGPGFSIGPSYTGMYFPAGEAHVKITDIEGYGPLTQIARINSADANDLMELAMWADACYRRGEKTIVLMPYLPGARADHLDFVPFGADVYARFINDMRVDQLICFDPHSPQMPSMLRNCTVIDSTRLVRQHVVGKITHDVPQRYDGIIAPDKGAVARAQKVADACHLPLYKADKHREEGTGTLSGFSCEPLPDRGKFLVVDDICDGGGTFMGLAEATGVGRDRLGLYVSHGVFSGQAQNLWKYFHEIWTTDSLDTAHNIDQPTFDVQIGGKLNFVQCHDYKVNVIPLANTLKDGYIK